MVHEEQPEQGGQTMGVVWTDERRAKFAATMAARRSGGGRAIVKRNTTAPALVDTDAAATPRPILRGDVLGVLDAAIVSATADIEALERTRVILARMQ
jgi:hypothetical protein